MTRDDIVAEARTWVGTPYRHQASEKGIGADCLGLIRGLWREHYGDEPANVPAYTADWSEPQGAEVLFAAAAKHLRKKPLGEAALGDVLLFRMRRGSVAKHLGIAATLGVRPTFDDNTAANLEVFLFDFKGDLYGETLSVALVDFLRGEEKFDGLNARDRKQAIALLEKIRALF